MEDEPDQISTPKNTVMMIALWLIIIGAFLFFLGWWYFGRP